LPELPLRGPEDVRALAHRHHIDAHDSARLLRLCTTSARATAA
jgi:hypothetical protein